VLKAVVDVNLVVSGIISKEGSPAKLLLAWRNNDFLLIISEGMLEETKKVLQYPRIKNKYNLNVQDISQAIGAIERFAFVLPDRIKVDIIKDDPDDNKVIACALAANADYIVSGDRHLLELSAVKGISIVTAKEFLALLE
jgi:hypothetical protein